MGPKRIPNYRAVDGSPLTCSSSGIVFNDFFQRALLAPSATRFHQMLGSSGSIFLPLKVAEASKSGGSIQKNKTLNFLSLKVFTIYFQKNPKKEKERHKRKTSTNVHLQNIFFFPVASAISSVGTEHPTAEATRNALCDRVREGGCSSMNSLNLIICSVK